MSRETEAQEWRTLNTAVNSVCAKFGKASSNRGRQDYWVSDDQWGGVTQRVHIYNPRMLTRTLMTELARSIRQAKLLGAQIEVLVDFTANGAASHDFLKGMLIVHAGGCDEVMIDIQALRNHFGPWFYTN